jgi:homoserine O-succinyltransferase
MASVRPIDPPSGGRELVVGLVNNMAPAAMKAAEAGFRAALARSPRGWTLRLRVFSATPAGEQEDLSALWGARLDGLIVTGTEPKSRLMAAEPGWPLLSRLVDWAAENTISTIWSCMAAHAAVYRLDGLERCRLPEKLSGLFECRKAGAHPLLAGAPARWLVPHSRHNGLDPAALAELGYQILSEGPQTGPDLFARRVEDSLFVMAQGHLEYGPESLPKEYRRDIRRFLAGESDIYPAIPAGCFDEAQAAAFEALKQRAMTHRGPDLLSDVDAAFGQTPSFPWQGQAVRFHGNWLSLLANARTRRARLTLRRPADWHAIS